MARIDIKIVERYLELQKSLPEIIDIYDINVRSMCKEIGMNRSTYYSKLDKLTFTVSELKKICAYINR